MSAHSADYDFSTYILPLPVGDRGRTFDGYRRASCRVGSRNYLGVLTSVNCSGSVAKFICEAVERDGWLKHFPNVDGVVPIVHGTGCGMSNHDEGYAQL